MAAKPNILLVLADDMGYSDIGCMGGEIETPNLDALAEYGQLYTQFYNTARCCPTRASLLSGLHPHQAGIGHMTNTPRGKNDYDKGAHGYRGFLNHACVTLAEALKPAGYRTYMSGKWHLGQHEEDQLPLRRGFDRFYGILSGACNYFRPDAWSGLRDGEAKIQPDGDFYSTTAFTDHALRFLNEHDKDEPFFLYLAYNAPHWPLQAPPELVEKYRGKYRCGWDELRLSRYRRMVEKGIVGERNCRLSPRDPGVRPWDECGEALKDEMDLRMAVYAAQIDCMDQNLGRVTDYLKSRGILDDTLILFLSDNGGCAEGGELGGGNREDINNPDIEKLMVSYGMGWANASNTPFRMYKRWVHEGGMCTPMIAHWPAGIKKRGLMESPSCLIDIMPTLLELSGAEYPATHCGNPIPPLEGLSLCPVFQTGRREEHDFLFWEHEDHCGARHGRFKAVQRYDTGSWELYDLQTDRSELNNIADEHPQTAQLLAEKWYQWAKTHHVTPKPAIGMR